MDWHNAQKRTQALRLARVSALSQAQTHVHMHAHALTRARTDKHA